MQPLGRLERCGDRGIELRTAPIGAVAPGVAITATVLSFSLLGDGLRDARGQGRRPRVS